jgi:DNA-binding response OmpR family regulator
MYTILAADDAEDVRALLRASLEFDEDLNAAIMPSAVALLNTAASVLPDLVILDVAMPELTGLEAFMLLREVHKTQHVPVLFLTAYPSAVTKQMLTDRCAVLAKPFALEDLLSLVRKLLQNTDTAQITHISA